jgi:hypothetical protein
MKVEIYCIIPLDSLLVPTYVTLLKRGTLEAPRDSNMSFDVSRRWALPISVDSGNLGPHKGRHLVDG